MKGERKKRKGAGEMWRGVTFEGLVANGVVPREAMGEGERSQVEKEKETVKLVGKEDERVKR